MIIITHEIGLLELFKGLQLQSPGELSQQLQVPASCQKNAVTGNNFLGALWNAAQVRLRQLIVFKFKCNSDFKRNDNCVRSCCFC